MIGAIVLAGGYGTRLGQTVTPKAMLKVHGKTLIQRQLDYLARQGFRDAVICLGHLQEKVKWYAPDGLKVQYLHDCQTLGTGGAVSYAFHEHSVLFVNGAYVVNVDDLCNIGTDFGEIERNNGKAIVFTKPIPYSVWIDGLMFSQNESSQHIGHTYLPMSALAVLPVEGSLEKTLAQWSKEGKVKSYTVGSPWLTVNTQEQLKEVEAKFKEEDYK